MLRREVPPRDLLPLARALGPLVDELWVVEDLPFAGGIAQAASVLTATADLAEPPTVGHGIAPAPFRAPAALAMEWAALAEMFPGRFVGGIGHGVPAWMAQIGGGVASPLTLLAETLDAVRRLLAGERTAHQGRYVTVDDVALEFPPAIVPSVAAGVVGPKSLAVAGRHADGLVLPEGHGPEQVASAVATFAEARQAAIDAGERTPGEPTRVTVFAVFALCDPADRPPRPAHLPPGTDLVGADPAQVLAGVDALAASGADSVVLVPIGPEPIPEVRAVSEAHRARS